MTDLNDGEIDEDEILRQKVLNCIPVKRLSMNNENININIQIGKLEINNTSYNNFNGSMGVNGDNVNKIKLIQFDDNKISWYRLTGNYR